MSFEDSVISLASWSPLVLYKNEWKLCRFPESARVWIIVDPITHDEKRLSLVDEVFVDYTGDVFEDIITLFKKYPKARLYHHKWPVNCDYTDMTGYSKDCYLSFVPVRCSNVLYSFHTKDSHDVISSTTVLDNSSIVYASSMVVNSHKVFLSKWIMASSNIWLSSNLLNCSWCRWCSDLQNKQYCIGNVQYSEEEFLRTFSELKRDLSTLSWSKDLWAVENFWSTWCKGSTWCISCEDLEESLCSFQITQGKNVLMSSSSKWSRERYNTYLTGNANHVYSIMHSGWEAEYCYNCIWVNRCSHVYYSIRLQTCSFCFWCVWLMNKSYCIFNKQYSKEERYRQVDIIFQEMKEKWILWLFFPATLCPFNFNDTVASMIVNLSKEKAQRRWFLRRDDEVKIDIPEWMEVVEVGDLWAYESYENDERKIDPRILKKVIRDEEGHVFRVIKMEYDFLMKYWLPLPRVHWLERLKGHFRK